MLRNLLAMLVVAVLGLAAWSVWRQLDQPVRAVRVQGALSEAEQLAIRHVVSESLTGGLLSLDVNALTRRIHDLSWPRTVAIWRVWPDSLVIQVEKASVVAAWGGGGYLTSAGDVVQLAEGQPDLPQLSTSMASPRRAMEMYQMLSSRVAPHGLALVRLEENLLGEWLLTLHDGMTVALGNEATGPRLERFLLAWQRALAPRREEVAHVDARYSHGVAVRWREPLLAYDEKMGRSEGQQR